MILIDHPFQWYLKQIRLGFSDFRLHLLPAFLAGMIDYWQILPHLFLLKRQVFKIFVGFSGATKYADAYYNRGGVYKALGKTKEANSDFARTK